MKAATSIERIFTAHEKWPRVKRVLEVLHGHGHQAVLAGGCVRDGLLGTVPQDFDIATSAKPEEIEQIFPKTLGVGKSFGVMMVIVDSTAIEVATFRRDGPYKDGRHPSEVIYSSLAEDARRRDFTVNGLFFDVASHQIIDEVGGIRDLEAKLIRAVGDPAVRFQEDHLRILRAIRFAAQLNFTIEKRTLESMKQNAQLLSRVSSERVFNEMQKMFAAKHIEVGLQLLRKTGVLAVIAPELGWSKWDITIRTVQKVAGRVPSSVAMAVWLFGNFEPAVERFLDSIKASNQVRNDVHTVHHFLKTADNESVRLGERVRILGHELGPYLLHCAEAYFGGTEAWRRVDEARGQLAKIMKRSGELPDPLITGEDLLEIKIPQGPLFGQILNEVYLNQLESKITDRQSAMALARSLAKL